MDVHNTRFSASPPLMCYHEVCDCHFLVDFPRLLCVLRTRRLVPSNSREVLKFTLLQVPAQS